MLRKTKIMVITCLLSLGFMSFGLANDAPVIDADQDVENTQVNSVGEGWHAMHNASTDDADVSTESSDNDLPPPPEGAHIMRMSQQVANLTKMNLPQQISDLRQQVAKLQGEIDLAERDLKIVSAQQARFYQDLSSRISKMNTAAAPKEQAQEKYDAPATASSNSDSSVKLTDAVAYQSAFKQLAGKQFDKAAISFQSYLKAYPQGKFASNAHYWLGEIAMHNKDFDAAYAQFQLIVAQYPTSNKVPDAKLKVAVIHAETGKKAIAKIELEQVRKEYPGSTAAQLADIQLQRLQ